MLYVQFVMQSLSPLSSPPRPLEYIRIVGKATHTAQPNSGHGGSNDGKKCNQFTSLCGKVADWLEGETQGTTENLLRVIPVTHKKEQVVFH